MKERKTAWGAEKFLSPILLFCPIFSNQSERCAEMGHFRKLIGAVKSGDTLGIINASLFEEQTNQFSLFPNPSTNTVNFRQKLSSIEVFDIFGRQVLYIENSADKIKISNLETGTYIIYGITPKGVRKVDRFVKK